MSRISFLLVLLAVTMPVWAQEQRGALEGLVLDQTGAVLQSTVELAGPRLVSAETTKSDSQGVFRFPALPSGTYQMTVSLDGFQPFQQTVELALGEVRRVTVTLTLMGIQESVHVRANGRTVDVRQATSGFHFTTDFLDKLPAGSFTLLATFAPSVNVEPRLGGISVEGASASENQVILDGVTTTDLVAGNLDRRVSYDIIGELQVKSSGYTAEHGGTTGGVINIVTRGGSAQFHGGAGTYWRADELNGHPRPTLRRNPFSPSVAEYVTYEADSFSVFEPQVTVGGPIRRERVWFFGAYVPTLLRTERTTNLSDGSRGTFRSRETAHDSMVTVNANIAERLRARFTLHSAATQRDGTLPNITYRNETGSSSPLYPWADTGARQSSRIYSQQIDYVPSDRLLVQASAGYHRLARRDFGVPDEVRYVFVTTNTGLLDVPAPLQRPLNFSNLATNASTRRDIEGRAMLEGNVTVHASFGGQHTIKSGVQLQRFADDIIAGNQRDVVYVFWNRSYFSTDGQVVRGRYGYYSIRVDETSGRVTSHLPGVFVQDAWMPGRRLTLNLGIRSERERYPSYDTSRGQAPHAFEFGFVDKLAPRLSFAYDVDGTGRWLAYGSYGHFFDVMKLTLARFALGGNKFVDTFMTLDTYDWPSLGAGGLYPGTLIERLDYVVPYNAPGPEAVGGIDPKLRPFEQREWTLGVAREWSPRLTLGARVVHRTLVRALDDVGVTLPGVGERYFIGNPGFGLTRTPLRSECNGPCPNQPRAERQYDALELTVTKRLADHWFVNASYVWSRLFGNHSGLASGDSPRSPPTPNYNRDFDALLSSFDQAGHPVTGRLPTDRPHQAKAQGLYELPFGTVVGTSVRVSSGAPLQTLGLNLISPFYPHGRGDLGRTPPISQTDLYLLHAIPLRRRAHLTLTLTVQNLFDRDAATGRITTPYLQPLNLSNAQFFSGFDFRAEADRRGLEKNPQFDFDGGYGPGATGFQAPRSLRIGLAVAF